MLRQSYLVSFVATNFCTTEAPENQEAVGYCKNLEFCNFGDVFSSMRRKPRPKMRMPTSVYLTLWVRLMPLSLNDAFYAVWGWCWASISNVRWIYN